MKEIKMLGSDLVVGTLVFNDKNDLRLAIDGADWMVAMHNLDNWLRSKTKHQSGLQDKDGKQLEYYIDAYSTVREELYNILDGMGLRFE
jgi:hypothetical protein